MSRPHTRLFLTLSLVPLLLLACTSKPVEPALPFEQKLEHTLSGPEHKATAALYQTRNFSSLWIEENHLSPRGEVLLQALSQSDKDALDPAKYHVQAIRDAVSDGSLVRAEVLLTDGFLRYGGDMGARSPHSVLTDAARAEDLATFLAGLVPTSADYSALRQALADYRDIANNGGWSWIESGPTLRLGDEGVRVLALRRRLIATGDLHLSLTTNPKFDVALEMAVYRFQERHGLKADGVVGVNTLADMNVSVDRRIAMLGENLQSLRADVTPMGKSALVVNIASAELQLFDQGHEVLRSRVIVGRRDWPTPLVTGEVHALEINPTWTVPWEIARKELLPKIRRDPSYLSTKGFRVLDGWTPAAQQIDQTEIDWASSKLNAMPYVLRQDPGPYNPLGAVKMFFNNAYQIFLHDTDRKSLYTKSQRNLSHGCVRVERIIDLAIHLLKDNPDWSRERFEAAVASGQTERVGLASPIPIYVIQRTAWVATGGAVHFRHDVYEDTQPQAVSAVEN